MASLSGLRAARARRRGPRRASPPRDRAPGSSAAVEERHSCPRSSAVSATVRPRNFGPPSRSSFARSASRPGAGRPPPRCCSGRSGAHRPVREAEVSHHLERVVVPVPHREVAPARSVAASSGERPGTLKQRRHAAVMVRSPSRSTSSRRPPRKRAERVLVRPDRVPADGVDVVHRGDEARKQLVRQRPELEAVPDRLVRRRAHLVRAPGLEQLALSECEAEVRPEELVRRADEDVHVPGRHVGPAVRPPVDWVRPRERPAACAGSTIRRTSGAVPTEFAAIGTRRRVAPREQRCQWS